MPFLKSWQSKKQSLLGEEQDVQLRVKIGKAKPSTTGRYKDLRKKEVIKECIEHKEMADYLRYNGLPGTPWLNVKNIVTESNISFLRTLLLILPLLTGCALKPDVGFDVIEIKTNEFLGVGYEHLDGKLFNVSCGGNGYASYAFVKNSCMHNTAKFVHGKGCEYFSMLAKNGDVNQMQGGYISYGVYIPYQITKYGQYYKIVLIKEDEKNKYKNFYKVSDYYVPQPKEAEK